MVNIDSGLERRVSRYVCVPRFSLGGAMAQFPWADRVPGTARHPSG